MTDNWQSCKLHIIHVVRIYARDNVTNAKSLMVGHFFCGFTIPSLRVSINLRWSFNTSADIASPRAPRLLQGSLVDSVLGPEYRCPTIASSFRFLETKIQVDLGFEDI